MKIGVLGGGQLGRMLALAGYPLGLEFVFYDHNPDACVKGLGNLLIGDFSDNAQLSAFAQQVDLVTVEFENIPLSALEHVSKFAAVYPSPRAVSAAQDRLHEKLLFKSLNIPTPEFYSVENTKSLLDVVKTQKDTLIVKLRRFGYDGKGQMLLEPGSSAAEIWTALGCVPLIVEQYVQFKREVSIIAVRRRSGDIRFYSLTENLHSQGILRRSQVCVNDSLQNMAEDYARRVLTELDYVGVLAFEFFDCDGELVANEIAPRVHNSGHWTIEGAATSQFENHLRAILDWPIGDTSMKAPRCAMYNLIGEMPDPANLLQIPNIHLHHYGKQPRPGRKLGHITLWDSSWENAMTIEKMLGT